MRERPKGRARGRLASAAFSTGRLRRLKARSRPARHLPEYAGAFAENGIDVSVLPHLTDQDLKDVVGLLGHRRKILAAVAELTGKSPSEYKPFPPPVEARDHHTPEPPEPAPVAPPPTKRWGAPACDGDVLRLGGFDGHRGETRRRGMP